LNKTVTGVPILECPALRFCWVFYFWLAGYTEYGCEDESDGPQNQNSRKTLVQESVFIK